VDLSRAVWRKSTFSVESDCVEVAFIDGRVAVRHSKDRRGPVLIFTPGEWDAFTAGIRDGQFQHGQPSPE
jgi:hypothetical protein